VAPHGHLEHPPCTFLIMQDAGWDKAMGRLAAAAPGTPFLVLFHDLQWQIVRWPSAPDTAVVQLDVPGLQGMVSVPAHLPPAGHREYSLVALADAVGAAPAGAYPAAFDASRSVFPSPPRGIDGARQNPGVRHAPVLDADAGVLACSACAAGGSVQISCPCGPAGHLLNLPCALCSGTRVVTQICEACGGAGSYLWPATLRIRRNDGGTGPDGDTEIALDVDLSSCDVSIERSVLNSGSRTVWEDRWVVDLHRPFSEGCRALGIDWPHGVVWIGSSPTIAARVSTAFSLLRMGTPTAQELLMQPYLDTWVVREGSASPTEVLDPEHLGMQAAAIVARISRGEVLISPLPPVDTLLADCVAALAPRELRLALVLHGTARVVVVVDAADTPIATLAYGATVSEALMQARHSLTGL
jgi:hypothetical protein